MAIIPPLTDLPGLILKTSQRRGPIQSKSPQYGEKYQDSASNIFNLIYIFLIEWDKRRKKTQRIAVNTNFKDQKSASLLGE